MTVDYGTDLAAVPDLDPAMPAVTGRLVLVEAIARRFSTPRGGLFYDADYGLDLREYLNEGFTTTDLYALRAEVETEARKDERVVSASARLRIDHATATLTVSLELRDGAGPFSLVLAVDAVTVAVLTAQGV